MPPSSVPGFSSGLHDPVLSSLAPSAHHEKGLEESRCNLNTAFKCCAGLSSPVDTVRSCLSPYRLQSASAPDKVYDVAICNIVHLNNMNTGRAESKGPLKPALPLEGKPMQGFLLAFIWCWRKKTKCSSSWKGPSSRLYYILHKIHNLLWTIIK